MTTKRRATYVHTGRWPYEPDYEIEHEDEPETLWERFCGFVRGLLASVHRKG